jgi:ribulose-phosphate 3-epimerase
MYRADAAKTTPFFLGQLRLQYPLTRSRTLAKRKRPAMKRPNLQSCNSRKLLVAPSILAADFARLGEEIHRIEDGSADVVHIDIMDGHFVPNLTLGPPVVEKIRPITRLPFDVHLMLTHPRAFVKPFANAGADHITIHVECADDLIATFGEIRAAGCSVGLCLRPKTPPESVLPWLNHVDLVLVMTVEPGFGGQSFMANMMPKVRTLRQAIAASGRSIHLEVDGGIDVHTVTTAAAAGANLMVAGTAVFRHPQGAATAIAQLHTAQKDLDQALARVKAPGKPDARGSGRAAP